MSSAFKIFGLLVLVFGILDFALRLYGISIHRIIGTDVPRVIGHRTYAFEIGYGALTMFVANYLKRPTQKEVSVIDLSDPFIAADAHYVSVQDDTKPFRLELRDIAVAFAWGSVVMLLYMIVFVRFVPGADAMLFDSTALAPKSHKLLVVASVLVVLLLLLYGIFGMKLREGLSVTAMISGVVVSSLMLSLTALTNPIVGNSLYGPAFMQQAYTSLGHEDGLPDGWNLEREIVARLEAASRAQRHSMRRFFN